jgi:HlyD family secretion protein
VEARVTSKIGFKVSGILVDLQTDVGDRVSKGTILARLDDREQSARLGRARAAIELAEANLERANANHAKAEANYANAESISERRRKLVQTNVVSTEMAETAKATRDAALADVRLAAGDVSVARAAISDAKAQEKQEAATLDLHTIASPYDAMVISRHKELGSALAAGESVFSVIDPQTIWILAYLDESKAGEISVGNRAEIVLRSLPRQRLEGRVARIQPESDRVNEERRIEVSFDRLPGTIFLGEQAEVYITAIRLPRALLVPESAILDLREGRGKVWVVKDGRLEQRAVEVGHRMLDGRFEIVGDFADGALVVSSPDTGFRIGRAATIAEGQRQPRLSRHQTQAAEVGADKRRAERVARDRDHDDRHLPGLCGRRAEAGPCGKSGSVGRGGGHQRSVRRLLAHLE